MIEVEEFDAGTIERLLHYLYFVEYSANASSKDVPMSASNCAETNRVLVVHARVIAAADYYQIASLKALAIWRFQCAITDWSSLGFSDVILAVCSILAPYDRYLKNTMCALSMHHWAEMKSSNWFEDTMTACGQFAYDIMHAREKIHDDTITRIKDLEAKFVREISV